MGSVAEGARVALCPIAGRNLEPAWIYVRRQLLWLEVKGPRDLRDRDARTSSYNGATLYPHVGGVRLH
jgi:hypothetical protein